MLNKSLRFLYDGWNLVAEFESGATGPLALKRTYAWVTDLSGSEQGAGGVGGLLFVSVFPSTINSPPSTTLTPSYDGNGNVTAWLEAATGAVSAAFDYDAFGNLLAVTPRPLSSSADAIAIPVGFSTKYRDSETGTLYYGYRDYTPSLGRWTSRDPLVEKGGVNLYEFVANSTIDLVDTDGRGTFSFFEKLFGLANLADTIGDTTEVSGIVAGYVGCMKTCPDCPGMLKQCIAASNSSRLRFQADCQRAWEVCRQRCLLNSNLGGLPGKINSGIYQPIPGL